MNSSKTAALILGPSLVIVSLLVAAYWIETRPPEVGAPLELHASTAMPAPAPPAAGIAPSPALGPALAAAAPAAVTAPKFDVVRVEPIGEAVVAGHAEPNSKVAVVANGKVIAEGTSDAAGQFVLLPPVLPPGEYALTLQMTPPSGALVVSDQNVAVSVPLKGKGDVMVALAEPGKSTVLLTDPAAQTETPKTGTQETNVSKDSGAVQSGLSKAVTSPSDANNTALPAQPEIAIKTAEIVEPGGFFATGTAVPDAHLRLYLNGSAVAEVTAGPDGHWMVKIGKGLVPGHYTVRTDQVDRSGHVIARAEVPFDYAAAKPKGALAQAASSAISNPAPLAAKDATMPVPAKTSSATVAEIQTTTVEKGGNLWRISRDTLGNGMRYTEIYAANSAQIRDPNLIYPGQVFVIPGQMN